MVLRTVVVDEAPRLGMSRTNVQAVVLTSPHRRGIYSLMAFLTRPAGTYHGAPVKACPCKCDRPILLDGSCHRCGRLPLKTIENTWKYQSQVPPQFPVRALEHRVLAGVGW